VTDDNGNIQRPNANYKLSKGDDIDIAYEKENLTFYYNRERRLAKAPQAVRDLYKNKDQKFNKFNLIKPLVADKPRAFIFTSIVILVLMILVLSVLGYFTKTYKLEGNKLEISGTIYEGTTIIIVKKTINGKSQVYTGAVDIAVSPPAETEDEQYPVFYHRIYFTFDTEEEYRFAVPFDSPELLMVLQTEKSSLRIKFTPE